MISLNTAQKILVELNKSGAPVLGVLSSDILSSKISVTKADGTITDFTVTDWTQIDPVKAPGLYSFTAPQVVLNKVGSTVFSLVPAATVFDTKNLFMEVGISSSDFVLIKKALLNNQVIDQQAGLLNIYDDNGIDVALSYYLQDEQTSPSIFNIRRKIRKA